MAEQPTLRTARLIPRAPRPRDAARMAELANDEGVARMTTSIPLPYTRGHAEDFIAWREQSDPNREAVFAVERPGEGFIGLVGLHPSDRPAPELGYWLGRPYWGRGHITEAVRAALDWAATDWKKRFVVSGHFDDNPASARVLVKAGFLYTGVVEPRYSVARGEAAATRMMVWLA